MHWSVSLVLFASLGAAEAPVAHFDSYTTAYEAASVVHRPMLVILNPAGDAASPHSIQFENLVQTEQSREVLNDYVVAIIDTGTEHGRQVYDLFGQPDLPRVVVIDNQQKKQIFRTSEALEPARLIAVLTQYRSGELSLAVPASTTAVSTAAGTSLPVAGSFQYYMQPGGCPNCRR
jgi:hypothetical protein